MTVGILIIDPQNDFCPGGALAVPEGDAVMEVINSLLARHETTPVFVSRDWHPTETIHFENWPVHCVANTPGAEFHADLELPARATVITKGTGADEDAYSAFHGCAEDGESLLLTLAAQGVTDLIVCGLATDYCVKATVLDACQEGFKVQVLLSGVRAVNVNPGDDEKALEEMADAGANFMM
jgi:nicotinamidase/pyrazinamidase